MSSTTSKQRGLALIHALLILGGATALTSVIAGNVIQQARSEKISTSRAVLDRAAVKIAALVDSTGTNPVAPAVVAGSVAPAGGGVLPAAVSPRVDGFGSAVGYCVGTPMVATDAVFVVLSPGGNKTFETNCTQALAGTRSGDDLAFRVNVAQLFGGFSGLSFYGATVAKEAHLGNILNPRAGEVRAVAETSTIYVNATGMVGDWTALSGGAAVVGVVQGADGVRRWADGSYGASCYDYRYPSGLKVYRNAVGNGVYRIQPEGPGSQPFDVSCDMTVDGGGWTVFQRRTSGALAFNRNWADYIAGFGNLRGDFWLGLDKLSLIAGRPRSLRVDLGRYNGQTSFAKYSSFSIDSEANYRLSVSGFVDGAAGDSLAYHNGMQFSAYDANHQTNQGTNCAQMFGGGWWYDYCHAANLNGPWLAGPHSTYADGVEWMTWTGYYESLTFTEMKVR
ncbi:fibrinogen-related domain-containing protein (plasmid) [Cupriavidus metallidurans]|uniref:fibrinogen C domain-containing protein n=1 Tax=Cupriavidus metallidurans TaxID=119219 RepID=UPI003D719F41